MEGSNEEIVLRKKSDFKKLFNAALDTKSSSSGNDNANDLQYLILILSKKMYLPGTKVHLKPCLENEKISKILVVVKWGGEVTDSLL